MGHFLFKTVASSSFYICSVKGPFVCMQLVIITRTFVMLFPLPNHNRLGKIACVSCILLVKIHSGNLELQKQETKQE